MTCGYYWETEVQVREVRCLNEIDAELIPYGRAVAFKLAQCTRWNRQSVPTYCWWTGLEFSEDLRTEDFKFARRGSEQSRIDFVRAKVMEANAKFRADGTQLRHWQYVRD